MAEDFEKVRRHTDSKWHEQGWRGSTNDPFRHDHKSSQFGWSTMAGGAEKQEEARLEGKPFKLNAWEIPQGREFYKNHLAPRLPGWFQCVEDRFPALSKEMRRRVLLNRGLGVAFSPRNAMSPPPLYTKGTGNILDGMQRAGIDRIVVISAAFVADQPSLPKWFKLTVVPALHNILEQMKEMEASLEEATNLEWTAVRPAWLIEKPANGELLVDEENLPQEAFRCRIGDLGAFMVDCVKNEKHVRAKPAVGAPEDEKFESPLALGEEFVGL